MVHQDWVRGPPLSGSATAFELPSRGIAVSSFGMAGKVMSENALCFWVGLVILLHQMADREMSIFLSRGQAFVTE